MVILHSGLRHSLRTAFLSLLLPAALSAQSVREPPSWPTPEEYLSGKSAAASPATTPPPSTAPAPSATPVTGAGPAPASVAPVLEPWTVQLAAFQEYGAARKVQRTMGPRVDLMSSSRDGEQWYVLVLGMYETRPAAEAAERDYQASNPAAATWVRSTTGLSEIRR